jgi:Zn-dependent protease with chaperone function
VKTTRDKKQMITTVIVGVALLLAAGWLTTLRQPVARTIAAIALLWGLGGVAGGIALFFRRERESEDE